ncbi:MAG: hypothetical protein LQ346_002775 [Caloplaca aetnensis]|nr:MAG: hypothetical protein LQ346_002775 [Caloplaca aetnensis]
MYEPSTAIAQFSTGRKHILGLADDGKVWQWNEEKARLIKPLHVDVSGKNVTRVVAGWDRASIYVKGVGIVYWPDLIAFRSQHATEEDAILLDTATVPGTSYSHSSSTGREDSAELGSQLGEVIHHVMLENYVVFTTSLNKVFLYRLDFPLPDLNPPEPVEITSFYAHDIPFEVRDLQGSFRSFAVFTFAGAVLMGDRAMLDAFHAANHAPNLESDTTSLLLPQPKVIPALQNNSVTSIAFGDHHFQALRFDGTILAYGTDNQSCGALGLGLPNGTGPLRGVLATGFSNGTLGNDVGRQVWFDPTMHRWLAEMKEKGQQEDESKARAGLVLGDPNRRTGRSEAITAMGDYFEREGRKWEEGVTQEGEMGSYFVLKVAAAGWHSAALVLVDEAKAELARLTHVLPPRAEAAEEDWHAGTWEDIDAPWDQLSKALQWCGNCVWMWIWTLARMFLGLGARDQRIEAERKKETEKRSEREESVGEGGERDAVRYRWTDQPFPRLRMANGEVMPGDVEITE